VVEAHPAVVVHPVVAVLPVVVHLVAAVQRPEAVVRVLVVVVPFFTPPNRLSSLSRRSRRATGSSGPM
jgi:hypothetical protein